MHTKLEKRGEDLVLLFEQALLDRLGIDSTTELSITTDGERILVVPVDSERRKRFEEALQAINEQYGGLLSRLAD